MTTQSIETVSVIEIECLYVIEIVLERENETVEVTSVGVIDKE